eukprot:comp23950_c0_seq2/m.42375 comp23950_c0_seq2/g.42375  ORF comp23950_c0_seq2/g.42375 comp23950_c0_seq2/m.42375 type:complete len:216 (-) comp23950_c0_seq2:100-747(-)
MNRITQPSLWANIACPTSTLSSLGRLLHVRFLSAAGKVEHVKVLFGSQTGTAMGFADELGEALQAAGIQAEVQDPSECSWNSDSMPLKEGDTVVLVQACAGQGEPTDNAAEMYNFLTRVAQPGVLKGVNYTIFGLGNQQTYCQNFNKVARDLDAAMERLGATRIFQRGEGDDSKCIEADFEEWQGKFLAALKQGISEPAPKAPEPMGVGQCTPQG